MGRRINPIGLLALVGLGIAGCGAAPGSGATAPTASLLPRASPTATLAPPTAEPTVAATIEVGPSPTPFKHIVRPNETILQIALLYGVTEEALRAVNPELGSGSLLSIGQELRIPDPEGNPIGSLIPSPTPIPLAIQPPVCYSRPTAGVWCLAAVRNASDQVLENLVVEIRLADGRGEAAQAVDVDAPLNFLPPGRPMPLAVSFADGPESGWTPSARVRSAIPANELDARYREPLLTTSTDVRQAGGLSWLVGGTLTVPEDAPAINRTLLLAAALDSADRIVGYAVWEPESEIFPGETVPFEVRVFSLGPPIARVELLAETYALARPRE